jgi:hypothetical protein
MLASCRDQPLGAQTRRRLLGLAAGWLAAGHSGAQSAAASHSRLWGRGGEAWDPAGRLPDCSFAGYACGERPFPTVAVATSVREFGAKGDGRNDDSNAFLAALAQAAKAGRPAAVLVPAGRYLITAILEIGTSGVVLRGEGAGRSVLVCPKPLNEIKPNWGATTSGQRTSNYSWSGGFVWIKGRNTGAMLGPVAAPARRGDRALALAPATAAALKPGDWIVIEVRDDTNRSLLRHLYSDDPGNLAKIAAASHRTSFVTRVTAVEGGRVLSDRPLRFDLRPEWQPAVRRFAPGTRMSGVEQLAFEFPARTYGGHFTELGFNAVAFSGAAHCWARDLHLVNADSGVFAGGHFCTIDGLRCSTRGATPARGAVFGHHGVSLTGHDNLCTRFRFDQRFIHDLTVSAGAGNVFSEGAGMDLSLDHHKRAPHENLFTRLDAGAGTRLWSSGGGADLGRHCGARGTFWNIRAERPQRHPGGFGPASMNLVGLHTDQPADCQPDGRWFEPIPPAALRPPNLHAAQLARRLRGPGPG